MATKTQSVTRRVMFSYDPNTAESVVTGTVVMDDGSVVNVSVMMPDCPEPDICDCDDLAIGETGPGTKNRIVWNNTEFTGNCEGGSERVQINGTSGNTPVMATTTITYLSNNGKSDVVRTSRIVISGSPVSVRVTVPACAEKTCVCGDLYYFGDGGDTPEPPVPGECGCNNVTLYDVDENCNCNNVVLSDVDENCNCNNVSLSDVDENCNCNNITLSDIVEGCDCNNVVLTDVIEGCDCDSVNLND
jgi:hypothetical protein